MCESERERERERERESERDRDRQREARKSFERERKWVLSKFDSLIGTVGLFPICSLSFNYCPLKGGFKYYVLGPTL